MPRGGHDSSALRCDIVVKIPRALTGWLGCQDSNLGTAGSKIRVSDLSSGRAPIVVGADLIAKFLSGHASESRQRPVFQCAIERSLLASVVPAFKNEFSAGEACLCPRISVAGINVARVEAFPTTQTAPGLSVATWRALIPRARRRGKSSFLIQVPHS